ncbi:MAG: tetratricopeptide repeat protein [Alphaproteobacteria bacterium]
MNEFMKEIEEDLRVEKMQKMWKEYGNYAISAILALLVGTGGFIYWKDARQTARMEKADAYIDAVTLIADGKSDEGLKLLGDMAAESGNYAALADLQRAGVLMNETDEAGNHPKMQEAAEILKALSSNRKVDALFRQASLVLYALAAMDHEDPKVLIEALHPATLGNNPWEVLANELTAVLSIKAGDMDKAEAILDELSANRFLDASAKARISIYKSHLLSKS